MKLYNVWFCPDTVMPNTEIHSGVFSSEEKAWDYILNCSYKDQWERFTINPTELDVGYLD